MLFVLLIFNTLVTRRQLGVQIDSQAWVAHSGKVLFELSETESLLKDAETGQRGYCYTGDSRYLTPYNQAVGEVLPQIDDVARLTADNPSQQARARQLRSLAEKKMAELSETIALYKAGKFDQAKELVLSDTGLAYMDQMRLLLVQMENEELSLERGALQSLQGQHWQNHSQHLRHSLLAAMGLALLAFYIQRHIEFREKHASALREREEWFRVTLTSIGDGVVATNPEGKVTFLNPIAEELTGCALPTSRAG